MRLNEICHILLKTDIVLYYADKKLILLVFSNKFCFAETPL
jgi:hypothetical protein